MMMLYDTVISWLSKNYHQAHFFCWTWSITVFCWLSNVTLWWGHNGHIRESFIFVPAWHLVGGDWRNTTNSTWSICLPTVSWWLRWKKWETYFDLNLVEKSGQKNVDQAFLFMNQVFVIFLKSEFVCPSPELNWDWKTAWHWRWRMRGDIMGDTRWLHGLTWRNSKGSWVDVILPDRHHTPLISGLGGEGLGNEKNATALNQIEKNGHLKKEMSHSDDNFMVV